LRATANVERNEYSARHAASQTPVPGLEAGGFLISPETLSALESLDLANFSWPGLSRVLLLSRDDLPHDSKLESVLRESEIAVEVAAGRGYAAMTASPQEAPFPEATTRII